MRSWLGEQVHSYYFIAAFFLGIIIGIVLSLVYYPGIFNSLLLLLAAALAILSLIKFRRFTLIFILISGVLLGLWRGSIEQVKAQDYSQLYNQNVSLNGKIVDDVTYKNDQDVRFKLKNVVINNKKLSGEVWVSTKSSQILNRSDTVFLEGFLLEGFGSFSASLVRSNINKVIRTSGNDIGLQTRDLFAGKTEGLISEPERSLGLGYLLGMKTALPEDLENKIQILGLTHVVVASGYNLTILVTFARRIFQKISKYLSAATGSLMIIGFILIAGFSPSMSRAGLVAGLSLLAWYYGRKIHPITLLIVAIALTLLIRPSYIWGDIGWYLSFTAFYGILVLAPLLNHYFWGDKNPSAIRELLVATFSAQIMTLPIIIHTFGSYSVYALLANLFVLPAVPFSMLFTFISGLSGFTLKPLAELLSIPANIFLRYCTTMIEQVANLPGLNNEYGISLIGVFIGYLILILVTLVLMLKTKHNFLKDKNIVD